MEHLLSSGPTPSSLTLSMLKREKSQIHVLVMNYSLNRQRLVLPFRKEEEKRIYEVFVMFRHFFIQ